MQVDGSVIGEGQGDAGLFRRLRMTADSATLGLRRAMLRGSVRAEVPHLPADIDADELERALRDVIRLEGDLLNLRRRLLALGPRDLPFDPYLALADELERVAATDAARLRALATSCSFPGASDSDLTLFRAALQRIAGRVARYVSDGLLPSTGGLDGLIRTAWPARRWWFGKEGRPRYDEPAAGLEARAVQRAVVLERALSGGLSEDSAETAESARWLDEP